MKDYAGAPASAPSVQVPRRGAVMGSSQRGGIILKLMVVVSLLVALGLLYLFRGPILRAAGGFWVVEDAPAPADAILVLGPDNYSADRATRAAELYRERFSTRVVASGLMWRPYFSAAELMHRDLAERGVPASAILRFPVRAQSTREEALALAELAAEQRWRRVIVVTSNYHTRRAGYILRRVMPRDVELRVVAAADSEYDPTDWWRSRQGLRLFFRECVGMPLAWWEMFRAP